MNINIGRFSRLVLFFAVAFIITVATAGLCAQNIDTPSTTEELSSDATASSEETASDNASEGVSDIALETNKKETADQNVTEDEVIVQDVGYVIGAGDLITVTVYQEADLSVANVRVGSNGKISFPLLGEVYVKNFTSQQLQHHIEALYRDGYLKKPKVTVSILEYRKFFVNGEVKKPGGYQYVNGLTAEKAVALAGGFTDRASRSKINLVRESNPDEVIKSVGLNTKIMPGDIITVGESLF